MKLEIDLNDILAGEFGPEESLQQSIVRQVIEGVTASIRDQVDKAVDEQLKESIVDAADSVVRERVNEVVDELLDTPYAPVSEYGSKGKETTLRDSLHSTLVQQCQFKERSSRYDENAYTSAVKAVVEKKLGEFKAEFSNQVTNCFVKDALTHATAELKKRLGVN